LPNLIAAISDHQVVTDITGHI